MDLSSPNANVAANLRAWGQDHDWARDGDEWAGQAARCGLPYDKWKQSLVEHLLLPYVRGAVALEIAPGHGRWTEYLRGAKTLIAVDLSESCLEYCRKRFQGSTNIQYWLTDGRSLPPELDSQVDFVWSFDSFVHMAPAIIADYLKEIARVLRPGGRAIIHHADVPDPASHQQHSASGWRSAVSRSIVKRAAEANNLMVVRQFVFWDEINKVGVPNHTDCITELRFG